MECYLETFSQVAKLNIVHVLLSLPANCDWPLLQFDVQNVFLHGDLKDEIYMDLPLGILITSKEGVVCKLRKSLYGLKQSPRAWFERFAAPMKKYLHGSPISILITSKEGVVCKLRKSLYGLKQSPRACVIKKYLASEFEMKSLGDLKYFLGIEVARSKHVSVVSQFMHSSSENHIGVVMCILRYLKVTPDKGLMFCKYSHTDVEGYTDVDWAGSISDRHSTSGSSAEAKYRGIAQGVCELLWLRRLLRDLGFGPQKPMDLYCDNKAAIATAHNPVQYDRTKHMEVDRHFVKEKLDAEIISFPFISSEYQLADVLTKAVSTTVFLNSLDKLGMHDIFAPT
ncbi:unnamed protein product [Prunus armeniaca]